jgi:hypothetical protein
MGLSLGVEPSDTGSSFVLFHIHSWPCGSWAGGTARGTAFWHSPWAARHGPHRARAGTTRRPVRVMGRRTSPRHGTGIARPGVRHGGRHGSRTPLRRLSPWQLQRPAVRAVVPPPPRPVLAQGAQDIGTPPLCGHVAEIHPAATASAVARESSAPIWRALHPALPTRAE